MSGITAPAAVNDYDAQYDADTLVRAAEIKADGDRHMRAKAFATAKVAKMKQVAGEPDTAGAAAQLANGYRRVG